MGLAFFKASRYNILCCCSDADVAQEVEHFLGKEEVSGSSPDISSKKEPLKCLSTDISRVLSISILQQAMLLQGWLLHF